MKGSLAVNRRKTSKIRESGSEGLEHAREDQVQEAEGAEVRLPFSAKAEWPYYWITRISARYTFEMERLLKPIGLDVPYWRVLSSLREHGSLSVSEISDYCILKLNTTTKIVQRMTAEGLVMTRSSRADGRVTEVTLTEAGEKAAIKATQFARLLFERTFSDFDSGEIAEINSVLKRIFERLG